MKSWLFGVRSRFPSPGRSESSLARPVLSIERLEDRAVPAVIAGAVYTDLNNNGIRDPGEPGIAGITIQLGGTTGRVLATALTDADGRYQFTIPSGAAQTPEDANNLQHGGRYTVSQPHHPSGYLDGLLTADNASPIRNGCRNFRLIAVNPGGADQPDSNFGELIPARLAGSVVLDTAGGAAASGAVVNLTGTDDRGEAVSLSRTTAADGSYQFDSLRPGDYGLTVSPPSGYAVAGSVAGPLSGQATPGGVAGISVPPGAVGVGYDFDLTHSVAVVSLPPATVRSDSLSAGAGVAATTPSLASFAEILSSFQRSLATLDWTTWTS